MSLDVLRLGPQTLRFYPRQCLNLPGFHPSDLISVLNRLLPHASAFSNRSHTTQNGADQLLFPPDSYLWL